MSSSVILQLLSFPALLPIMNMPWNAFSEEWVTVYYVAKRNSFFNWKSSTKCTTDAKELLEETFFNGSER